MPVRDQVSDPGSQYREKWVVKGERWSSLDDPRMLEHDARVMGLNAIRRSAESAQQSSSLIQHPRDPLSRLRPGLTITSSKSWYH